MTLPRVEVIALGGTIASVADAPGGGVSPGLTAADLVAAVPGAAGLARIGARNLANVPSTEITPALLLDLGRGALPELYGLALADPEVLAEISSATGAAGGPDLEHPVALFAAS